ARLFRAYPVLVPDFLLVGLPFGKAALADGPVGFDQFNPRTRIASDLCERHAFRARVVNLSAAGNPCSMEAVRAQRALLPRRSVSISRGALLRRYPLSGGGGRISFAVADPQLWPRSLLGVGIAG